MLEILLDCVEPANMLMSCVTIWPHCMLTKVNCGSAISSSPNATNEIKREFGNSWPVTDIAGDEYPSPYLGDMSREYLSRKRQFDIENSFIYHWIYEFTLCLLHPKLDFVDCYKSRRAFDMAT